MAAAENAGVQWTVEDACPYKQVAAVVKIYFSLPFLRKGSGVRVSSGHLCEAEAPTEAAAENSPSVEHRLRQLTYGVGAGLCARP